MFSGYGGDEDCLDGLLIMDADRACTATFTELFSHSFVLTVNILRGAGAVFDNNDSSFSCTSFGEGEGGVSCSRVYPAGQVVSLGGGSFEPRDTVSWTRGCDNGTGQLDECLVDMYDARSVDVVME